MLTDHFWDRWPMLDEGTVTALVADDPALSGKPRRMAVPTSGPLALAMDFARIAQGGSGV